MLIKDLEINKELTREDLSAVRGGDNFASFGDQYVAGGGKRSETSAIYAPYVNQEDNDIRNVTKTNVDITSVSVFDSFKTRIKV